MTSLRLSIVLPTINEAENLSIIPDIQKKLNILKFKIMKSLLLTMIDDNTVELIKNIMKKTKEQYYFKTTKSFATKFNLGRINEAKYEYVMWLDADGSMTPEAVEKILGKLLLNKNSAVIGSRFVEEGGYKGVKDLGNRSFLMAIKNVRGSKDSVMGMIVSIIFNKFLELIFPLEVNDITSGFIVGKKEFFDKSSFVNASYGEYFLYVLFDLWKKNINIIEVGYICETRVSGESKTASSLVQLISRGLPYINAAIILRRHKYGN